MNTISSLRIAARIYDNIGDYHTADQIDLFIREAGKNLYSPKDLMKALPIMMGMGAFGNVLTPLPTKPPLEMQQLMKEQSFYDQHGEDSKFDFENYKPQAKQIKPIVKPIVKPDSVEKITESPKTIQPSMRAVREKPIVKRESPPAMQGPKGNFDETMKLMLNLEGGKTDESSDKGGRTNLGITQRTYNQWLRKNKRKPADVFNIEKSTALQIYREGYWNVIKGDKLPHNVAKAMMSMALTDGPQDSVKFTQKLLGIEETGFMGPKTLSAIWAKCKIDDVELTKNIMNNQILRYRDDEDKQYVKGWENRAEVVINDID